MRNLIFCLLLVSFIGTGHSQIVLRESRVNYNPNSMKVNPITNSVTLEISESGVGEFQKDPLAFIQDNFDIQQFILQNSEYEFDGYDVEFRTSKGVVKAKYDKYGEMVSTHQRFKDVALPDDVKLEILRHYRSSQMLKNHHIVTSRNWMIDKEFYRVKIQDGDKVRRLKIDRDATGISLASL